MASIVGIPWSILSAIGVNDDWFDVAFYTVAGLTIIGWLTITYKFKRTRRESELAELVERQGSLNRFYENILEGAGLGAWEWMVASNKVHFDRRWCEMIGLDHGTVEHDMSTWDSRVHPDDRAKCYGDIRAYLEGKIPVYENIHRLRHSNGTWVWILSRGRTSARDENGNPTHFTGTHFDITRFKETERLSLELQRVANIGGWEMDARAMLVRWTDQTFRIHALAPQDFLTLERATSLLKNGDRQRMTNFMQKGLTGTAFRETFEIADAMGAHKWIDVVGVPILGSDGKIHGLRGTIQDITDKKKNEGQLRKRDAYIQALFTQSREAMVTVEPPHWRFTSANQAALELFGLKGETELLRWGLWDLSPERQSDGELSNEKAKRMMATAMSEGRHYFDWDYQRTDGTLLHCTVSLSKVAIGNDVFLQATVRDVTLERNREIELREVMNAIRQCAVVATTDMDGKIRTVNDELCRISGYSRDELLGSDYTIIISNQENETFFKGIWSEIRMGKTWSGEMHFRTKCSRIITVRSVIAPVHNQRGDIDRAISIHFDISEQKRLQDQLEEAQRVAKIGSWSLDLQTRRLEWSKQMFELFPERIQTGPPTPEQLRMTIHPDDREEWEKTMQKSIENGKPYTMRFRSVFPDKVLWIEAIGHGLANGDGRVVVIAGTCQDISEKVENERFMEQQRLKTIQAAKLASLGEVAAGVAHEINNPLTIIKGTLPLLNEVRADDSEFPAKMDMLNRAVIRITRIVNGLRRFSRASDGTALKPNSLAQIMNEAMVITDLTAKRFDVSVKAEVDSHAQILCDQIEIEQVIINLINNGIDAAKDSAERWVKVHIFEAGDDVVLHVIDSGSGISAHVEAKLFQPFFTTKPIGEGTGLGLSICKGILEQHKATINLNHSYIRTCFEVRFRKHGLSTSAA